MKYIFLTLTIFFFYSCKGQKDKIDNKNTMNTNNRENAPYNVYKDGKLEVNYDEVITKNKNQIKKEFQKYNYQYPSLSLFIEKIKYYYSFDINKYEDTTVVLDQSLSPVIAIKDLPALYIDNLEGEVGGLTLLNYNQFIFYDSKTALLWLKKERPDLIIDLVKTFGFDKDDNILKFVFGNVDFKNKFALKELIFEEKDNLYTLRNHLVKKIRKVEYNNQIINSFSETIQGDFYYTLSDIIKEMADTPNDYKNNNYTTAFLLNELALSGITGYIDYFYENYPAYKESIINNGFYNLKMLREYTEKVYENNKSNLDNNDISIVNYIQDPDGYTNLRKEKSTKSEIVKQLKNGEEVEVLNTSDKWYLIKTREGKEGYVYYDRIKIK